MPANLRALFREPSGIAAEFQKNFTTVTAFQKEQRKRMQKLAQSNDCRSQAGEQPSEVRSHALCKRKVPPSRQPDAHQRLVHACSRKDFDKHQKP
ncbi:hypothetical protein AAVH_05383 [Aphelenchoides avenae]|nr:hypothetical protein AAVH_05383 [Aphelenchus avenae]